MFFFEKELKAEEILRKRRINGWGGGKERTAGMDQIQTRNLDEGEHLTHHCLKRENWVPKETRGCTNVRVKITTNS